MTRKILNKTTLSLRLLGLFLMLGLAQAQQKPSIDIPILVNDTSFRARQDGCDRYRANDRGEVDLRHALRGLSLKTVVITDGYSFLDSTGALDSNYPGLVPVLLDEIALRAGFTWRESYGVIPSLPPNVTWTNS